MNWKKFIDVTNPWSIVVNAMIHIAILFGSLVLAGIFMPVGYGMYAGLGLAFGILDIISAIFIFWIIYRTRILTSFLRRFAYVPLSFIVYYLILGYFIWEYVRYSTNNDSLLIASIWFASLSTLTFLIKKRKK